MVGIEPTLQVLETRGLPLTDTPKITSSTDIIPQKFGKTGHACYNAPMDERREILHSFTQEDLKKRVAEAVGEFPFGYDLFYSRMQRLLRISGISVDTAIRDTFVIDEKRRITGFKPLPSKDSLE